MTRSASPWVWPVVALMSSMCTIFVAQRVVEMRSEETSARRLVTSQLSALLGRQREYYQSNLAYAAALEDLDLTPRDDGWRYRVVATRVGERPMLLLEAENGRQRYCMDERGSLSVGELEPLPPVAPWLPAPGGVHAEKR